MARQSDNVKNLPKFNLNPATFTFIFVKPEVLLADKSLVTFSAALILSYPAEEK
jgi:hypothetical protein